MKKNSIRKALLGLTLLLQTMFAVAQSPNNTIHCGTGEKVKNNKKFRESYSVDYSNKYNNLNTWIPLMDANPLKNPPITTIEVSFHIFLDQSGGNSLYTNDAPGLANITGVFNHLNNIYAGGWGPSDPTPGLVGLPNNDTRIRFSLGTNNERIYFYNSDALNHGVAAVDAPSGIYQTFLQTNYPARNTKLNVFFTAGRYGGFVQTSAVTITNGGSGYTSSPTVTLSGGETTDYGNTPGSATASISGGKVVGITITYGGSYFGTLPPTVTISGGGGIGATATISTLYGGATGVAVLPDTYLPPSVSMPISHEVNTWVEGFTVAHELGHILGMLHTYSGGGGGAICSCTDPNFLSDIFGTAACVSGVNTKCPHSYAWTSPWGDSYDPPLTNNVMGGSNDEHYFSPMQAGIMHRTLALSYPKNYVVKETYSSTPLTLTSSETWDFSLKLYRDVVVDNNSTLTITNTTFELPYNAVIRVKSGSTLRIEGTVNNYNNNNIIIESGGYLKITSTGIVNMYSGSTITINTAGYLCLDSPSSLVFKDPAAKLIINGKVYYGLTLGAATASAMSYSSVALPTGTNFYTSVTTSGTTTMSTGATVVKAKTYVLLNPNTSLTPASGSYMLGIIQTDDYVGYCPPGHKTANPGNDLLSDDTNAGNNDNTSNSTKVMPNPSAGNFMLDLSAIKSSNMVNVTVKNNLNETVFINNYQPKTIQEINLRNLQNGIYFMLVTSDSYNETHRIIIEK